MILSESYPSLHFTTALPMYITKGISIIGTECRMTAINQKTVADVVR